MGWTSCPPKAKGNLIAGRGFNCKFRLKSIAFGWIENVANEWPHNRATHWSQQIQQYLALIRKLGSLPDNAAVIPLLKYIEPLLKSSSPQGKTIYYQLWGELKQTDQVPNLDKYRSLSALQAIWEWENQACGYTGSLTTSRYTQKGGAKKVNPDAKRRKSTAVWATFAASGTRDMRKLPNGLRQGDALIFSGVGAMIPKMQAALDDGWVLHARVVSGIDYGWGEHAKAFDKQQAKGKPPVQPQAIGKPPEEHSIMLIGYDGNEFVFWDPDSTSSSLHGQGFGSVFFADNRLSTAENNSAFPVNDEGDHQNGEHRYQIILVSSQ